MLSDERINELSLAVARGEISQEDALALARQTVFDFDFDFEGTTPAAAAPAKDEPQMPWASAIQQDKRIPLEQATAFLQREEGLSRQAALERAIRMSPADTAPLAAAEAKHYAEQAALNAERDWKTSPKGIEAMGRERQALAAANDERAAAMRVELEARGIPVGNVSTEEILELVDGMAAEKAAAAEANSLEANLAAIAATDAAAGEGQ